MDCNAVVLNKLLTEQDLNMWSKLKLAFLDPAYSSLYRSINRYYEKYSKLPSFDELELVVRETPVQKTLATLKLADTSEISAEVALDALIDQYTQSLALEMLDKFVDKLPIYDTSEIKDNLASIVLTLDEKTLTSENVFSMSDMMIFQRPEDINADRVYLGLNNTFDSVLGGVARQELILFGGKRGSGKSITCSNLQINQYEAGNTSVYFTIEMIAKETLERNMSILAKVPHANIKKGTLNDDEVLRLVKARAGMFEDADALVDDFMSHRDRYKFEEDLVRNKQLRKDAQMVIIDDRSLTISSIDLHLGKLKAKFGDKLTLAVVDYLNQIVIEGASQYEWMPQVEISKKLKNLARKHNVVIASPYQIDSSGEARFAKGILDAADIALVMDAHDKDTGAISYETTKIRGGKEMSFTSPIDWDTLRISSTSIEKPATKEPVKRERKQQSKQDDSSSDIPWSV